MHKSIFVTCIAVFILALGSCRTAETIPSVQQNDEILEIITLEGEFRSTKGVMTSLSCYCYNSGVIKQADESTIDLCFEENVEIPCTKIRVTGIYITESKQVDENNPCASGSMELFKVISYTCL